MRAPCSSCRSRRCSLKVSGAIACASLNGHRCRTPSGARRSRGQRSATPRASRARPARSSRRCARDGDAALSDLTQRFDGVRLDRARGDASKSSPTPSAPSMPPSIAALDTAIETVRQVPRGAVGPRAPGRDRAGRGVRTDQCAGARSRPVRTGGVRAAALDRAHAGGTGAIAGCAAARHVHAPNRRGGAHPAVLVAARNAGVEQVFKVGGAQAIAAMAYGTATIPKCDKIFGPGNAWVTAAKQLVAGDAAGAAADLPAGVTEVLVIADRRGARRFRRRRPAGTGGARCRCAGDTAHDLGGARRRRSRARLRGKCPRSRARRSSARRCARCASSWSSRSIRRSASPTTTRPNTCSCRSASRGAGSRACKRRARCFSAAGRPNRWATIAAARITCCPTYGYASAYSGLSLEDFQKRITVQELTPAGLQGLGATARRSHGSRDWMRTPQRSTHPPRRARPGRAA